jgi:nitrogenase molybdenum-iron protein beta chain
MSSVIERPRWTCALGGALAAAGALPRTIPVMHAGPGCAGNFSWTQNGTSGLQIGGRCAGLTYPSTNLQENEVVFGGLDRLNELLKHSFEIMDGDLFFVLTGCVPEVIGDDVESVVNEYANSGKPVIFASTAGFKGDSYFGYDQVLKALFQKVVKNTTVKQKKLVNLWGIPPMMDVFWKGNLIGVQELLSLIGVKANIFFGQDSTLAEIEDAARAELNIVVSDLYGVEAAKLFKELHGVDYISTPLPFGAAASDRFLRTVGSALGFTEAGLKQVEAVIEQQGRQHYEYLEPILDVYNDMEAQRYAIVLGDANYAYAVADFLAEDLGWLPDLVVVTDDLSEDSREILQTKRNERNGLPLNQVLFESNSVRIKESISDDWRAENWKKYHNGRRPVFVAGSSLDRSLATSLGAGHLSLSFPVSNRAVLSRGYTGYSGGLRLTEDVVSAVIALR